MAKGHHILLYCFRFLSLVLGCDVEGEPLLKARFYVAEVVGLVMGRAMDKLGTHVVQLFGTTLDKLIADVVQLLNTQSTPHLAEAHPEEVEHQRLLLLLLRLNERVENLTFHEAV